MRRNQNTTELFQMQAEINALRQVVSQYQQENQSLQNKIQSQNDVFAQNQILKRELKDAEYLITQAMQQAQASELQAQEADKRVQQYQQQPNQQVQLQLRVNAMLQEIMQLKQSLMLKDSVIDSNHIQYQKLEQQVMNQSIENEGLQEANDILQQNLSLLQQQKDQHKQQIQNLTQQIFEIQQSQLQQQVKQSYVQQSGLFPNTQIQSFNIQLNNLNRENADLKESNTLLSKQLVQIKTEYVSQSQYIEQLKTEHQIKTVQMQKYFDQFKTGYQNKWNDASLSFEMLKQKLENTQRENEQLKSIYYQSGNLDRSIQIKDLEFDKIQKDNQITKSQQKQMFAQKEQNRLNQQQMQIQEQREQIKYQQEQNQKQVKIPSRATSASKSMTESLSAYNQKIQPEDYELIVKPESIKQSDKKNLGDFAIKREYKQKESSRPVSQPSSHKHQPAPQIAEQKQIIESKSSSFGDKTPDEEKQQMIQSMSENDNEKPPVYPSVQRNIQEISNNDESIQSENVSEVHSMLTDQTSTKNVVQKQEELKIENIISPQLPKTKIAEPEVKPIQQEIKSIEKEVIIEQAPKNAPEVQNELEPVQKEQIQEKQANLDLNPVAPITEVKIQSPPENPLNQSDLQSSVHKEDTQPIISPTVNNNVIQKVVDQMQSKTSELTTYSDLSNDEMEIENQSMTDSVNARINSILNKDPVLDHVVLTSAVIYSQNGNQDNSQQNQSQSENKQNSLAESNQFQAQNQSQSQENKQSDQSQNENNQLQSQSNDQNQSQNEQSAYKLENQHSATENAQNNSQTSTNIYKHVQPADLDDDYFEFQPDFQNEIPSQNNNELTFDEFQDNSSVKTSANNQFVAESQNDFYKSENQYQKMKASDLMNSPVKQIDPLRQSKIDKIKGLLKEQRSQSDFNEPLKEDFLDREDEEDDGGLDIDDLAAFQSQTGGKSGLSDLSRM
ncbi:Hypothetical_protein [Hexamita inflata]|uniref:Hypothetical_protein n=1 Tax=Hexamita inflata TaxID=28002 RepID=A0AA86TS14_9EUKA|nr:Hypothetical protein HINF_LOCUS14101 [Hexamita inflata]